MHKVLNFFLKISLILIKIHENKQTNKHISFHSVSYPKEGSKKTYFGCDGEFKRNLDKEILCYNNGIECPELKTWKEKEQATEFEPCFNPGKTILFYILNVF